MRRGKESGGHQWNTIKESFRRKLPGEEGTKKGKKGH